MKHILITTIAAVVLVGCGPKAPKGSVHIYAQEGDIVAVKQHLAAGTDVNAKDDYIGMTILQSAALGGQKEIVELLIAKGADVNAKGREGHFTPLDTAFIGTDKETADLLRKHGGKTSKELKGVKESIQDAVKAANIEAVKEFLAEGVDVNAEDEHGNRPLYIAVEYGRKEIVELLIANGADLNVKGDTYSDTPLNIAASYGHKEIAKILIVKGADVNARDWEGNTPLDKAKRHPELADLLRKHGGKTGEELKAEEK